MPGVIVIRLEEAMAEVIGDILLMLGTSDSAEFENQVVFLPL